MIAIINYKERMRVVFILGQDSNKVYCLASERIPEEIADHLSKILYSVEDLGSRIEILRQKFAPIYKTALRVFNSKDMRIVETYDKTAKSSS
jgi:hypothetical protein